MTRKSKQIIAADLFCGAGGTSTGLRQACERHGIDLKLIAVNHWEIAISTHSANHPGAEHLCANLDSVDPRKLVPNGKLDLLVASPECCHHSIARGGKPINDQSRASAWRIVEWCSQITVDRVLIENVKEFCFPVDTLVWTESGLLPIQDVQVGMRVLTHQGRWRAVTAVLSRKADTVLVKGTGNSILECTSNHPIYARKITAKCWGGQRGRHAKVLDDPEWVSAEDLVIDKSQMTSYRKKYSGYFYATPRVFPAMPIPYFDNGSVDGRSEAFWRMIGLWLGDGSIRRRRERMDGLRICANHAEAGIVEAQLAQTGLNWNRQVRQSVVVFEATNRYLAEWLVSNFGQHAYGKTIPAWVMSLEAMLRRALIEGYEQADGHLHKKDGRQRAVTVSKKLAIGLKAVLESISVPVGVGIGIDKAQLKSSALEGDREIGNRRQAYWLSWKWNDRASAFHRDDNLHRWTKVRKVESGQRNTTVYDLNVEEDHSFVADGVVVHNCTWGPLGTNGRPLKKRRGETYIAFLKALESLGYTVEARILNAADFGDPTSRERLFIQARRGRKPIRWPEPTHAPAQKVKANGNGHRTLFDMSSKRRPYRTAREIIDWSVPSESIFARKRPLSPNTLARIWAGLQKFCGLPFVINSGGREVNPRGVDKPLNTVLTRDHLGVVQPFLVKYYGGHDAQSLDEPLPAVTANYEHYGLAEPFIIELRNGQDARSIDAPLSTITTKGMHHALCRPFIVVLRNNVDARSIDEPLSTVAASGLHHALCQPFVMVNRNNNAPKSIDEPLPTLCTGNHMYLIKPFMIRYNGNHEGRKDGDRRNASVDDPIPTLDTSNRFGLVQPFIKRSHSVDAPMPSITTLDGWGLIQPFIVAMEHGGHERSIDKPLNTITTARGGAHGLVQPYLVKYNGTAGPLSVDEPLDTVTAKDRFGLVTPELQPGEEIALLDIHFRMLQPHELAAAMGFPRTYVFTGNREQRVKQIGNAVPVSLARALCATIISDYAGKEAA
jgi:DNA (cytosine-5)-methyltransferase 1